MNKLVKHLDDDHFVVNMYGLHNANLLRNAIPRELASPKPIYADRRAHHDDHAATLRISQTEKRAVTQAKRKATMEAKKAKKLLEQGNNSSEGENGEVESEDSEEEFAEVPLVVQPRARRGTKRRRM